MPFIHANIAARLDDSGRLRTDVRASCPADLHRVHLLRETYPAIIVGRQTFELDRPKLTARREHLGRAPLSQPRRYVLTRSPRFATPPGIDAVVCPGGDLARGLRALGEAGITGALLETGPRLLSAALEQGVLDALTIYLAGEHVGTALGKLGRLFPRLPEAFRVEPLGEGHLVTFDLIAATAPHDDEIVSTPLRTAHGRPTQHTFRDLAFGREHGLLVYGDVTPAGGARPPLVRIHSECWTSSQMQSRTCDCQPQLEDAHRRIAAEGRGILMLHNAEGRGIGRLQKTRAYRMQAALGVDTMTANRCLGLPEDAREYFSAGWAMRRLGVSRIRLLTNNPGKVDALRQAGIDVVESIPLSGFCTPQNVRYLTTKVQRGHHARLLESAGVTR